MGFFDRWYEVIDTMRRHRLRTLLTALSVAWGIFMLVLLLGAGNGLKNAVQTRFADDAVNSIWVRRGKTSLPYRGQGPGRKIEFSNRDYDALRTGPQGIEHLSGRFRLRGAFSVSYKSKTSSFDVVGAHPGHLYLEKTIITAGRYINELDIQKRRKVAVIGDKVVEILFGDRDPLGEHIKIGAVSYRVVGVFWDAGREGELRRIWIPISTAQIAHGGGEKLDAMMFTVGNATVEESERLAEDVRMLLAGRHRIDPNDKRALRVRNNLERYQEIMQIFDWIAIFIWIVGAGTIVAGIVGVSNIMLISVKERTREFGVRKAAGATPWAIVSMVLSESVLLTAVAGYIGLVAGVGVLELVAHLVPDNDYFANPEVSFGIAVTATLLLVACGTLAGYFPARGAARVNPVVALRND